MSASSQIALILQPDVRGADEAVGAWIDWAVLAVELVGAVIVLVGVVLAILHLLPITRPQPGREFGAVRLRLASHLVLGLEFLLAADILATAVNPTWEGLGQLAAIAAIRTLLNFFLMREMREVKEEGGAKLENNDPLRPVAG